MEHFLLFTVFLTSLFCEGAKILWSWTGLPHLPQQSKEHGFWLRTPGEINAISFDFGLLYYGTEHESRILNWMFFQWWMFCSLQTCCECGPDLQTCPICRSDIHTRIKLYWSASVYFFAEIHCNLFLNWSKWCLVWMHWSIWGVCGSRSWNIVCNLAIDLHSCKKMKNPRFKIRCAVCNLPLKI